MRWAAFLCGVFFLASGLLPAQRIAAASLLAAGWLACALYPRLAGKFPSFAARLPNLALAGILILALLLRMRMTLIHVWFDEMVTMQFCRLPWDSLTRHIAGPRELISPFMLLVYRFLYTFTHDPVMLRSVNVLFGVLAVYVAYRIGRLSRDRGTGLWFAFFLVCASQVTYFTVELRSYGLLLLSSMCSVYFYLRELKGPSPQGLRWYAYSTAVMVYAHFAGFAVLGVQMLAWLVLWKPLRLAARQWCECFLFISLMGAFPFWYAAALKHGQFHYFLLSMYPQPHATTLAELAMVAGDLFQRTFFAGFFALLLLLVAIRESPAAMRAFYAHPRQALRDAVSRHYRTIVLGMLCAVPVAWLFFCRIEQRTVFYYSWRYVIPSVAVGCFFLALAMTRVRGAGKRIFSVTVAVMVGVYSAFIQWDHKGYAYDEHLEIAPVYQVLRAQLSPGDRMAMLMNETFWHWQAFNEFNKPLSWVSSPMSMAAQHNDFRAQDVREDEVVLSSLDLLPGQRLWLLLNQESAGDPAWRWLLSDPRIRTLGSYPAGGKLLYLFQRE